ncbi:TFIIB-type zinc ribbon-containing protein [Streptomyces triticirhizae]|uniref:Zf-TFIIB domain containing protein n=1 Tax=Streptomyces triticirhizae TaxID=2483353 RepID=A0A3M2L5D3_9ACTN|nr:zf-TFIIB domain-containing protein [Streptomyces triticirhizae]RMI31075.1 zf-TFIIB domain containing protein [Streptomyces triticirhizae]
MQCPKCGAPMRTFNRSGVQIEQCDGCRGIFLDYGELEHITQLESQWAPPGAPAPPPPQQPHYQQPPPGPGWGAPQHGGHHGGHYGRRRKGGLSGLFFSS